MRDGQSVHMALAEDFITCSVGDKVKMDGIYGACVFVCPIVCLHLLYVPKLKALAWQTELSFQTSHIIIPCQTAFTATRDFTTLQT